MIICVGYKRLEKVEGLLDYVVEVLVYVDEPDVPEGEISVVFGPQNMHAAIEAAESKALLKLMTLSLSRDKGTQLVGGNGSFNGDTLVPFVEFR